MKKKNNFIHKKYDSPINDDHKFHHSYTYKTPLHIHI